MPIELRSLLPCPQPLSVRCISKSYAADQSDLKALRTKFQESLWKLIVYAALTVAGGLIIHDAGWLEDTTRLWSNWPHQPHG